MFKVLLMGMGILMSSSGALIYGAGADPVRTELLSVPCGAYLILHPLAAIWVGLAMIAVGMNCGTAWRGR